VEKPRHHAITPIDQITRQDEQPGDPEIPGGVCSLRDSRRYQNRTRATEERQESEAIWDEDTVFAGHHGGLHGFPLAGHRGFHFPKVR
jgi:hypothetical protein